MKETVLVSEVFHVDKGDFENAGSGSTGIRGILRSLGIKPDIVRRVAVAVFEAEMNICMYAQSKGEVRFNLTDITIRVIVEDCGVGIPDLDKAMKRGWSTATDEMRELGFGAGLGLPNMKDNADTFDLESEVGKGTRIEMTFNYI